MKFNRSSSSNHLGGSKVNNFDHIGAKRGESSPSFQDLPSSEEINIDECGGVGDTRTTMPTSVTSPLGTEMLEFPDFKDKKVGLNSPSLVSTLGSEGLSLATASPLNNFSAIKFPGSSGSSTQISQSEKKVSSSVKKMSSSSTMSGGTGGLNYTTQSTEHSSETASASVSKRFAGWQAVVVRRN